MFFFFPPVPLSVRKNNFQICQLTHSPHVLTREVQGKRERVMENLFRKRTKICLRISCAAANNNNTSPKKKKKTDLDYKNKLPMQIVQPNFFLQLPILSGISRNLALTEIQGKGNGGGGGGPTKTPPPKPQV